MYILDENNLKNMKTIEINEGWDNRDNDFCLPLAKYGGLDKDRKISLL